tara:strand:+ start:77 stop:316 length:240 start_codon:yes stop_codon:yes gene_type:complete
MPQIGWFEILIIVVLAIVIIGPKDFPFVLKKIGNWMGSVKRYFNEVQKSVAEVENIAENEVSIEKDLNNQNNNKKKDER